MESLDIGILRQALAGAPEGIALCDVQANDQPVIYVNPAFEQLTGYAASELLGANLRLLQGADRDQEGRKRLREALARGEECRVLLRNYRKNGEQFWNEMFLRPLRNAQGVLTHYAGYHRDAANLLKSAERTMEGVPTWLREDRVSGVSSLAWFEELLGREWRMARRESRLITLMLFDIDALGIYNETFGRQGGDACIRRIARGIAGVFRRGTDVVGRWHEGAIAVLVVHRDREDVAPVMQHARMLVQRIAEMRMHHPRVALKYLTVTAGAATLMPGREEESPTRLVELAKQMLAEGKREQRGALTLKPPG